MAKTLTTILLTLVVGLSGCNRGQTSVASRRETSAADSEIPPAPCGKVMRLDGAAIKKRDLYARSSQLVTESGFTDEELKEMKSSKALLAVDALGAYESGYSTWYKPTDDYQAQLDYAVTNTIHSKDYRKLAPKRRAVSDSYLAKFEKMMVKAHSVGKNDSQKAPCPF
jgi:hypothetical protein